MYHYVIVRKDIPIGAQLAQTVHAAGESALFKVPPDTHAIVLAAKSEEQLREIESKLLENSIPHRSIIEIDPPYENQLMAIGLIPSRKTSSIKKVLSQLPLVR